MTTQAALQIARSNDFDGAHFLSQAGIGRTVDIYRKNQSVFCQGDTADKVFFISRGCVKLTIISEQGKEAIIGLLEDGQFLGESCLNGDPLRTATATAMQDCAVTAIEKSAMLTALQAEPAFAEFFMSHLLARNSRIEEDLADHLFNSSEKRLARLLLILAHFGEDSTSRPIDIDISQEILADMIGTTRSRVSFFMNRFRKRGFISYGAQIQVHSSLLDAVLSDRPMIHGGR